MNRPLQRGAVWLFRATVLIHTALLGAQPVLIGLFLSGDSTKLQAHSTVGSAILTACAAQGVAAILVWRPGRWSIRPFAITLAMFIAELIQLTAGYARNLGLHVPLGVALVTTGVILTTWAWWPRRPPHTPVEDQTTSGAMQ